MSQLPKEWLFESFDKIGIQVIDGDRGNNYPKQNEFEEEGFCLFLSAKNVTKRGFEFYEKQFINEEKDSLLRKGKLTRGDLVLTTRGTVGNVAYYNQSIKYDHLRINSGMVLLRTVQNVDNLYLYIVMTSGFVQDKIKNISFGSAQPQLTVKEIKKFKIPLPLLEEQKKIADILSTVNQKIAFVEDNISQTKELKKGLRQELFRNGIGHSNFHDTEFGKRPESWKIEKLGDLTSLAAGGTPSTKVEEYWNPQEVPWLSSGEVNKKIVFDTDNMISEEGLNNSAAKLVSKNSVLMGLAGQGKTRGTVAITETELSTNQSVASILPSEDLDMYFIYHNLDSRYEEIRAMSTGVGGRGGLNLSILKSIKIALPPIEEQKQIANILKTVDIKLEILKEKKESLLELKKGLMQKLLTGEVRV